MIKKYRMEIFSLVAGSVMGFLLFHPYTMLVYSFMNLQGHGGENTQFQWKELFSIVRTTFNPMMLPMAIAFGVFNGIIGLLIGALIAKKRRVERQKIALETLNRLMITLSHYLLNANTVIGGMARHCKRTGSNNDILCSLEVIEEQAREIDAVIKALKAITEIKTADYTTTGKALMIDITCSGQDLIRHPSH
jgi:hypothetical protein